MTCSRSLKPVTYGNSIGNTRTSYAARPGGPACETDTPNDARTAIAAQNRTAEFGVWDMGTLVWLVGRWLVGEDDGVCGRAATTVNLGNIRLCTSSRTRRSERSSAQ